jgi:hypothetical protein
MSAQYQKIGKSNSLNVFDNKGPKGYTQDRQNPMLEKDET